MWQLAPRAMEPLSAISEDRALGNSDRNGDLLDHNEHRKLLLVVVASVRQMTRRKFLDITAPLLDLHKK